VRSEYRRVAITGCFAFAKHDRARLHRFRRLAGAAGRPPKAGSSEQVRPSLPSSRNGDTPGLIQTDRTRCGRRQVELPAAYPGTAIVDADSHASVVTYDNMGAERQRAMRRRHCRAIQPLAVCGTMTAQAVASAVDARDLPTSSTAYRQQQHHRQRRFHNAAERPKA
jgi:hypothetical protein